MSTTRPGRRTLVRRTPLRLAAVLAAVALVAGCGSQSGDGGAAPTPGPGGRSSATGSATASPSPTAEPRALGVYYVVDTRVGFRLAREIRDLPGKDPAAEAVRAMIAGAVDPDYGTTWNPATRVLRVTRNKEVITVDLSGAARTANAGSEAAALMVQQLVYTVTEAVDKQAAVRLLIDGKPPGDLWGVVRWDKPVRRAAAVDVRSLVQIDSPRDGETTSSPVTVKGEAATFEANVPWRVLDTNGKVVKKGFTMTSEGQTFAPFSFDVALKPGTYTIEISEDDPSGGAAGTPMTDSKTVTVR